MTPRLKKLLVGFAISLVILVSDRVSQSSGSSSGRAGGTEKKEKNRPRTARIDANRMRQVKRDAERNRKSREKKVIRPSKEFNPIPEEVLALADWGRNPFSSQDPRLVREVKQPVKKGQVVVSNVTALKIESVARLGDKIFVIINGQRFREGDTIDNMLIETIESEKIIFKVGTKRIVKNVGT